MRQFSEQRQPVCLFVRRFYHHENRRADQYRFDDTVKVEVRHHVEHRANHLVRNQPRDEEVEALKRVEPHRPIVAETVRSEHHDRSDPADPWHVAENGCRPRIEGFQAAAHRMRPGERRKRPAGARRIWRNRNPPALPGFRIGYKMASTTPYESRALSVPEHPRAGHANIFAMKLLLNAVLLLAAARLLPAAKNLEIYFIDVEGGQATLMLSPGGESMLVDTGWGGFNRRDAERIAAAAKKAGVKRIDYLVITHFHTDHVGGVRAARRETADSQLRRSWNEHETGKPAEILFKSYAAQRDKGNTSR